MNDITYRNIYEPLLENVSTPIELYESILGKYFIGYADNLTFGSNNTSAWARLYNPIDSGVILHVNVWTITDVLGSAFRAQFWFNATPPKSNVKQAPITPTNLVIKPTPKPKVKLEYASNVTGNPIGGIKAFVRRAQPETTLVESENGKIMIGEGGNFLIFLSTPETQETAEGRVAFGWWEEKIHSKCR